MSDRLIVSVLSLTVLAAGAGLGALVLYRIVSALTGAM